MWLQGLAISLSSLLISLLVLDQALEDVIFNGLNDYTSDSQLGDVGQSVRLEAINSAGLALRNNIVSEASRNHMIIRLCAMATESSDAVRFRAASCLERKWDDFGLGPTPKPYVLIPRPLPQFSRNH